MNLTTVMVDPVAYCIVYVQGYFANLSSVHNTIHRKFARKLSVCLLTKHNTA